MGLVILFIKNLKI